MHLVYVVVILLFTSTSFSKTNTKGDNTLLDAYVSDAKISQSTADIYRSYKLHLYLYENHKDYFYQNAVSQYITGVRELGSLKKLREVCDLLVRNKNIVDKVNYSCGLELFHVGDSKTAKSFLTAIGKKSKSYYKAQVVLASIYLGDEDHVKCLAVVGDNARVNFVSEKLSDVYYLTKARCQAKGNLFKESIVSYQSVSADSRYYFEALTELSWVFFKIRDVELVRNTVKVIQASFKKDTQKNQWQHATIGQYYFSKYLTAYLDLVVYGSDKKEKFSDLEADIGKYLVKEFIKKDEVKQALNDIESAESYSDLAEKSKVYSKMLYHFSQWLSDESLRELDDNIRILIAVNKEIKRFEDKVYTPKTIVIRAMRVLKSKSTSNIKTSLAQMYDTSLRIVNGFRLKIKIGEVDLKNLSRTEGLKSLDEATTIYKEKENSLSQKMGLEI